jgi:hypothetical protein
VPMVQERGYVEGMFDDRLRPDIDIGFEKVSILTGFSRLTTLGRIKVIHCLKLSVGSLSIAYILENGHKLIRTFIYFFNSQ